MITRYFFNADTAELLSIIQWPAPGVKTAVRYGVLPEFGLEVTMRVKEGDDAEREMIDWRQRLGVFATLHASVPAWLVRSHR